MLQSPCARDVVIVTPALRRDGLSASLASHAGQDFANATGNSEAAKIARTDLVLPDAT